MKWVVVVLVPLVLAVGALVFWPSTEAGPPSILHGRDTCHRCRMIISEPGFAAERRTKKGSWSKYDDLGCLLVDLRRLSEPSTEVWVEDLGGGPLLPLTGAVFVRGQSVKTPMGYGVVAFATQETARRFAQSHGAAVVPLETLLRAPLEVAAPNAKE